MSPGTPECKENNAVYVKTIMPRWPCCPASRLALSVSYIQKHWHRPQKELDTMPSWSIIIFTSIVDRLRYLNGRPGHQAADSSTTGNAEPTPESRTRRTVYSERFLRSSRSGPGQVRDVAPGTDRR